ncbi:MAG: general secretion pathway protein GspB [Pseudomonadales bacterium]
MSFILDAIKKSEDERQRSKGPDVYSLQAGAARHRQPAPAWARALLLLLSMVLLVFIASWLWPRLHDQFAAGQAQALRGNAQQPASQQSLQQPSQQSLQPPPHQPSQQPSQQPGQAALQQVSQERANQAGAHSGEGYSQAGQIPVDPVSAQAGEFQAGSRLYASDDPLPPRHLVKELWEFPADYQSTVPDLKFSFHVFSKAPEKRTIIINGRRLREGQMITSQLRLRSITDTGVICHYRGQFFHVDVVEKW